MTDGEKFLKLFEGNAAAHYEWRGGKQYVVVDGPLTLADIEAHLRGEMPAMLSIPTLPAGEDGVFRCHFYAGDADRHRPEDLPVDFVAVAKRITDLQLPLVLVHSKSAKSAHVLGFFKDPEGWPCGQARHLIHEFMKLLEIGGELEFFPKQVVLKDGQTGSGLNLCYFGSERWALDKQGERLDLAGFLKLAEERAAYGDVLVGRYLKAGTSAGRALGPSDDDGKPMPVAAIRRIHQKHLDELSAASGAIGGRWDEKLNTATYYAARAFAAGALETNEQDIKAAITKAAGAWNESEQETVRDKLDRSWADGLLKPLTILESDTKHDEALMRLYKWLEPKEFDDGVTYEDLYSDLALLTREEYETERKQFAKELHIRPAELDAFVAKRRAKVGESEDEAYQNIVALFKPSEPWPEPVNGAELLEDISRTLRRFIVFREEHDAGVFACWCVGTHLYAEMNIFPRQGFTSALPDSGKTTCLDCAEHLCLRAVRGDNITTSIFFRVQEAHHPTWILDEMDTFIHDNPELVGVMNSGHREGGYAWRSRVNNDGTVTPERFATYGPVCYAMIGHPPVTLFSRTVVLRLESKNSSQIVEDFNPNEFPEQGETLTVLRRKIARWAEDHRAEIKTVQPATGNLSNRKRNNWRALLKIAQVAGGRWADMLLTAAGSPPIPTKKSVQEKFLRDIRNIFHTRKVDRIPSDILIADLLHQHASGWNRFHGGREPLDAADLAEIAIDFGIEPKPLRLSKDVQLSLGFKPVQDHGITKRGYTLESFQRFIDTSLTGEPEEVEVSALGSF